MGGGRIRTTERSWKCSFSLFLLERLHERKERLFSSHFFKKIHHPQTIIMLRRSAARSPKERSPATTERNVKTGNDRAEEGMVRFSLSLPLLPLLFLLEIKGNRSFDFGFLPYVRTMLCRVTDVVFFLSLFQTRSSLIHLSYYVQLEAKAA